MESDGLIQGREEVRNGRKRRVYRATAAGRRAFAAWLRSERDEDPGPGYELFTSHPLVKLLFSSHLEPAERRAKLVGFARAAEARLELLEGLLAEAPGEPPDSLSLGWLGIELEQQRSLLARLGTLVEGHEAHCADSLASS